MPQNLLDLKNIGSETAQNASEKKHAVYISWEAEEYEYTPKKRRWFIVLMLLTAGIVAVAIIIENYFFAVFTAIAGTLLGWLANARPRNISFAITSDGIEVANRLYLFEDLNSFWIFYEPPLFKELSIESKKIILPYIKAPLGETDPEEIRRALKKFIPERKQDESLLALLLKVTGF